MAIKLTPALKIFLVLILLTAIIGVIKNNKINLLNKAQEASQSAKLEKNPTPTPKLTYKPGEFIVKLNTPLKTPRWNQKDGKLNIDSQPPSLAPFLQTLDQLNLTSFNALNIPTKFNKNIYVLRFPVQTDKKDVIDTISSLDEVAYIEPNYIYRINDNINDPLYIDDMGAESERRDPNWNPPYSYQWNLKKIHLEEALDYEASPTSRIKVGVIDTGVFVNPTSSGYAKECGIFDGPGYMGRTCKNFDFIGCYNPLDPLYDICRGDYNGHGTHVAGIMAATQNNEFGISGMSNNIEVSAYQSLDKNGFGSADSITSGIYIFLTSAYKARVLNMSFGGPMESKAITEALSDAYFFEDTVLVAASGNSGTSEPMYPAASVCINPDNPQDKQNCVIAVGSSDVDDKRSYFSSWGNHISVVAPGGGKSDDFNHVYNIVSLRSQYTIGENNDAASYKNMIDYPPSERWLFLRLGGTSMAAPHVSALAGMILNKHPKYSAQQVKYAIENSTDDIGAPGFDSYTGYGRINTLKALRDTNPNKPVKAHISFPVMGTQVGQKIIVKGSAEAENLIWYKLEYRQLPSLEWQSENVSYPNNNNQRQVISDVLGILDLKTIPDGEFQIKLSVQGPITLKESVVTVTLDKRVKTGWPYEIKDTPIRKFGIVPVVDDINSDYKKDVVVAGPQTISVINHNGVPYPGWDSKSFNVDYIYRPGEPLIASVPTVGDIDNGNCHRDCDKEIFFSFFELAGEAAIDAINDYESYTGYTLEGKLIFFFQDYKSWDRNIPMIIGDVYNEGQNKLIIGNDGLIFNNISSKLRNPLNFDQIDQDASTFSMGNFNPDEKVETVSINDRWIGSDWSNVSYFSEKGEVIKVELPTPPTPTPDPSAPTPRPTHPLPIVPSTHTIATPPLIITSPPTPTIRYQDFSTAKSSPAQIPKRYQKNTFLADIDGDSVQEAIFYTDNSSRREFPENPAYKISTLKARGDITYFQNSKRIDSYSTLTPADFDQDNKTDFILDHNNGTIELIKNDGALLTTFDDPYHKNLTENYYKYMIADTSRTLVGDIDNDGYQEFVKIGYKDDKASVHFYRIKGDKVEVDAYPPIFLTDKMNYLGSLNTYMALDDIDADGKTDLIITVPQYNSIDNIWQYFVYAYNLGVERGQINWGQYKTNSEHTNAYVPDKTYWKVSVDLVCKDGSRPTDLSGLQFEHIVYPAQGTKKYSKSITSLPYSTGISSGELPTSVYAMVVKDLQYLAPTGSPSDPNVKYATAFRKNYPAAIWRNDTQENKTNQSPYQMTFQAPDSICQ